MRGSAGKDFSVHVFLPQRLLICFIYIYTNLLKRTSTLPVPVFLLIPSAREIHLLVVIMFSVET